MYKYSLNKKHRNIIYSLNDSIYHYKCKDKIIFKTQNT